MKEGKVINYDGFVGEIESQEEKYLFLNDDLQTDINVGDIVTFNGEEVHDFKRAYFVKSKSDNAQLSMKVKNNERNNN